MGLVDNYKQNRRKKKLEEVNKALDKLKSEHPFDPQSFKPKTQTPSTNMSSPQPPKQSSNTLFIMLTVLFGVLAGVFLVMMFLYKGDLSDMEDQYDSKRAELAKLKAQVEEKEKALDNKESELKQQVQRELNLTGEKTALRKDNEKLEDEIDDLKDDVKKHISTIVDMNKTIIKRENEIDDLNTCIKDKFKEDPDKCD